MNESEVPKKSYCSECGKITNHEVIEGYTEQQKIEDEDFSNTIQHRYEIIKCKGCDRISFRILYSDDIMNDEHWDVGTDIWKIVKHFPGESSAKVDPGIPRNLPQKIRLIYQETLNAYYNNLSILCSAGIRIIIQAICLDKKIESVLSTDSSGKRIRINLYGQIEGLVKNKYLTEQNAKILHDLRFIGNDALHQIEKPSKEELKIALTIIDLIIKSMYELDFAGEKLKRSIQKRLKKK